MDRCVIYEKLHTFFMFIEDYCLSLQQNSINLWNWNFIEQH